ncbi:MAG: DHH family phosphoesterase [Deltaproteobacteria bacterium]|nr:DHH family phosphoesterase [Deltaproteobacteria bacterium]
MTLSASEKLSRLYAQFSSDDHVLVVFNADPDAIASAMAMKRLLWRKVSSISLSNINVVSRPDNVAMIKLLGVSIKHIEKLDMNSFNRFVIVDSQPGHNEAFSKIKADVVIDHHPDTNAKASFHDIRPHYGATASIMTEYLRAARIKPSAKLATGLFHAIKTDTNNFQRQTQVEDLKAFQFLFRHVNVYLERKIEQAEMQFDFLKYFKSALESYRFRRGRLYAHLGNVNTPDLIVIIADFFMRVNTVSWSIVAGIYEKKLVIVFRSDGLRKNAGKVAENSFGYMGSAGGHKSAARAEIPLDKIKLTNIDNEKKILNWIIHQIEKKSIKRG